MKYLAGLGVPQDLVRAGAWFALASINTEASPDEKKQALQYSSLIESKLSADQIAEAIRLGRQLHAEIRKRALQELSEMVGK